ncbi:MAG: hypothetical protein LBR85_01190 [Oscillospiraceae bacterium]|nr:hypothetical protein [Oscillospiraceae bacterium]
MKKAIVFFRTVITALSLIVLLLCGASVFLGAGINAYAESAEQFLTTAVFFTSGRGGGFTVLTVTMFAVLTFPLHNVIGNIFSQNHLCIYIRSKSRLQWFASSCLSLFLGVLYAVTLFLSFLFIIAAIAFPVTVSIPQYLYLFFLAETLTVLFMSVVLLTVNLLAMLMPLPAAILSTVVFFSGLGSLPLSPRWLDLLNPVTNFYFDYHTDSVIKAAGFGQWESRGYPYFTPTFSIIYFVVLIFILLLAGWLKVRRMDILGKDK